TISGPITIRIILSHQPLPQTPMSIVSPPISSIHLHHNLSSYIINLLSHVHFPLLSHTHTLITLIFFTKSSKNEAIQSFLDFICKKFDFLFLCLRSKDRNKSFAATKLFD
ncbi:hypothetical protein AABB24_034307, partial [Solanum stoloniferum]